MKHMDDLHKTHMNSHVNILKYRNSYCTYGCDVLHTGRTDIIIIHMDDVHMTYMNSHVSIPKYRTRTSHMAAMYYTQGGQTYTWHTDCVHMTHMDELCHALMHHTTHTLMTA